MENSNSKVMTISFALASAITGFTVNLLIKIFAGAFGVIARFADSDFVRHGLPLLVGISMFLLLQLNPKVRVWAEEVIVEIKKVVWPSRRDTVAMTVVVVIMVLISSVIISTFDLLSGYVVSALMR